MFHRELSSHHKPELHTTEHMNNISINKQGQDILFSAVAKYWIMSLHQQEAEPLKCWV